MTLTLHRVVPQFLNTDRKNRTPTRAMVAAKLATLKLGANQHEGASIEAPSQPEAAKLLNVGRAQVQRARVVRATAAPALIKADP